MPVPLNKDIVRRLYEFLDVPGEAALRATGRSRPRRRAIPQFCVECSSTTQSRHQLALMAACYQVLYHVQPHICNQVQTDVRFVTPCKVPPPLQRTGCLHGVQGRCSSSAAAATCSYTDTRRRPGRASGIAVPGLDLVHPVGGGGGLCGRIDCHER